MMLLVLSEPMLVEYRTIIFFSWKRLSIWVLRLSSTCTWTVHYFSFFLFVLVHFMIIWRVEEGRRDNLLPTRSTAFAHFKFLALDEQFLQQGLMQRCPKARCSRFRETWTTEDILMAPTFWMEWQYILRVDMLLQFEQLDGAMLLWCRSYLLALNDWATVWIVTMGLFHFGNCSMSWQGIKCFSLSTGLRAGCHINNHAEYSMLKHCKFWTNLYYPLWKY